LLWEHINHMEDKVIRLKSKIVRSTTKN